MTNWRPVTCELLSDTPGRPHPAAITWRGHRLPVIEIGRRWRENQTEHLLIRVADGRVFEMRCRQAQWEARVVSTPPAMT